MFFLHKWFRLRLFGETCSKTGIRSVYMCYKYNVAAANFAAHYDYGIKLFGIFIPAAILHQGI